MFKQKSLAKKTGFLFLIMAGLFLANINFVEAAEWAPITDLSSMGIAADDTVSLSDFIIVIYDFLLSAVGIAAMFMIVVGGFRYLTAAGNAAALSEAKDIIYSALYGLLLALCVWIIVSTINPDLVYLKQPGADPTHGDYGCLPNGSACNTCAVNDGCKAAGCPAPGDPDCLPGATSKKCCSEYQTGEDMCSATADGNCKPAPDSCASRTNSSEYIENDPNDPDVGESKCTCYDEEEILLGAYADCDDACKSEGHCGWNFLVVRVNTNGEEVEESSGDTYHILDSDKSQLWDFFLTNNGGWDRFMISPTSYDDGINIYECAILVTARRTITVLGVDIIGDYRNIFWVLPGTVIHRNASSLEKDLCHNFAQCCHKDNTLGAMNACKIEFPILQPIPGCDDTYSDPDGCAISRSTIGSDDWPLKYSGASKLFKAKYTDDIQDRCGNENIGEVNEHSCSLAISNTEYRPNRDIVCDPATGMWR